MIKIGDGTSISDGRYPFSDLLRVHRDSPQFVTGEVIVELARLQAEQGHGLEGMHLAGFMGKVGLTLSQLGDIFHVAITSLQQFPVGDKPADGTYYTYGTAITAMEHSLYYLNQISSGAIREAKLFESAAICGRYANEMLTLASNVEIVPDNGTAEHYFQMARDLRRIELVLARAQTGQPVERFLLASPIKD